MPSKEPTMQTIADLAGVSKMSVSRILRGHPHHNRETKEKVLGIAKRLGYRTNPLISALMTNLGQKKSSPYSPVIGLIHALPYGQPLHPNMIEFRESAYIQANSSGYGIEEFYLNEPGMSPSRLIEILTSRGIHGIILEHFWVGDVKLDIDLSKFASVSIGLTLVSPRLHRVDRDHYNDMMMAMKKVRSLGYNRIGIANIDPAEDTKDYRRVACFEYLQNHDDTGMVVPPMKAKSKAQLKQRFKAWLEDNQPDVVMSQHMEIPGYLKDWGYKVPRDIGFLHLDMCKTLKEFAGIYSNWAQKGIVAVNQVVDQLNRGEFGVPQNPITTVVESRWMDGPSLKYPQVQSAKKRSEPANVAVI